MLGSNGQEVPRAGEGHWAPELMQGTTTIDRPPPAWGLLGGGGGAQGSPRPLGGGWRGRGGPHCGAGPLLAAAGRRAAGSHWSPCGAT